MSPWNPSWFYSGGREFSPDIQSDNHRLIPNQTVVKTKFAFGDKYRPETTMPRRPREFASAREAIESGRSPRNRPPRRQAMLCGYCGPNNVLPRGYDYFETRYRCLQKGFGAGKYSEKRKWQEYTGQPVDPSYPLQCPHLVGNNVRDRERRNGRAPRNSNADSGNRRKRSARSSRLFRMDSSDDESSSSSSGNRKIARATKKTNSSSSKRKKGARSSRRRVPCC